MSWQQWADRAKVFWRAYRCGALGPALNRSLHQIMFYLTTRCNSRCRHCSYWQKPPQDLPIELFEQAVNSKSITAHTWIGLEGGEFLLYPYWKEALDVCRGKRLELFSNGLLPDRLCQAMEYAGFPRLTMSLDGTRETYQRMRGVDGYDRVLECVRQLHNRCDYWISFTFSPYNSFDDFLHVWNLCQTYNINFGLNFFSALDYNADVSLPPQPVRDLPLFDQHPEVADYRIYVALHNAWHLGKLQLPCVSICNRVLVYPNGDVPLCQQKYIPLGNLHQRSLDEIWLDPQTLRLLRGYRHCNGCWVAFHRHWDMQVVHDTARLFGERRARRWFGNDFSFELLCHTANEAESLALRSAPQDLNSDDLER